MTCLPGGPGGGPVQHQVPVLAEGAVRGAGAAGAEAVGAQAGAHLQPRPHHLAGLPVRPGPNREPILPGTFNL